MGNRDMKLVKKSSSGSCFVYHETIDLSEASDIIYILPYFKIYAISAYISGNGVLQFTNDDPSLVSDISNWSNWDGISQISNGLTAFRVVWNSGTVIVKITVKAVDP